MTRRAYSDEKLCSFTIKTVLKFCNFAILTRLKREFLIHAYFAEREEKEYSRKKYN